MTMKKKILLILLPISIGFILGWLTGPVLEHLETTSFLEETAATQSTSAANLRH